MFFEQEGLHEALVPMLQSILDSAGADNSSSLTAIITQFLKSQGKRRPISRKRQASLDLDSLKSHGKISPQTFIQGWSLVTLRNRNSVQLQGWSLVTLRKCTADCLNCCSSCASQWSATGILADLVPCVHTACQRSVSQLTQTLVGTAVERVLDSGQLEIYPCVFDVTGDLSLCL